MMYAWHLGLRLFIRILRSLCTVLELVICINSINQISISLIRLRDRVSLSLSGSAWTALYVLPLIEPLTVVQMSTHAPFGQDSIYTSKQDQKELRRRGWYGDFEKS